jgi:hypothetical protein
LVCTSSNTQAEEFAPRASAPGARGGDQGVSRVVRRVMPRQEIGDRRCDCVVAVARREIERAAQVIEQRLFDLFELEFAGLDAGIDWSTP